MHKTRVAAIDCGTNTFNLLIVEKTSSAKKIICKRRKVVKLGSKGLKNRTIDPEAEARAVAALQFFKELIDQHRVTSLVAVGTSALRDSKNGPLIIDKIRDITGIPIQLIDGDTEAYFIYRGVSRTMKIRSGTSMIMDIGGGSTEFILCNDKSILWKKSFRLGAARLSEYIQPSDPIKQREIARLESKLESDLSTLFTACKKFRPQRMIGSSGSFETFAAILLKKSGKKLGRKTQYQFRLHSVESLHKKLIHSTYAERLAIPGMWRMRADQIIFASLILTFVLRKTKIEELHLSTASLREGLIEKLLESSEKSGRTN